MKSLLFFVMAMSLSVNAFSGDKDNSLEDLKDVKKIECEFKIKKGSIKAVINKIDLEENSCSIQLDSFDSNGNPSDSIKEDCEIGIHQETKEILIGVDSAGAILYDMKSASELNARIAGDDIDNLAEAFSGSCKAFKK